MNMQEAADHADGILDATLRAVRPAVRWGHATTTAGSRTVTRRRTVTTVVSAQRRGSFLGVVERFWTKSGYEITGVNTDEEMPGIFARTPDGFQLTLDVGHQGQVFFDVTTPRAERSDPAVRTVADDAAEPRVHCAFWSAPDPLDAAR